MPTSSKQRKQPKQPKEKTFVQRSLEGMTKRLEKGESLGDLEVPLFLLMLNAHSSKELINYVDKFGAMQDRITKLEAHLRTQQNIRQAVDGSRKPMQNVGPPNFSPYENDDRR